MSDVQITKIILRRGIQADLPTALDAGELAFTTDTGRLFLGTDPSVGQPQYQRTDFPYQNVEVLTENATDAFAKMHGDRMREGGGLDYYSAALLADQSTWANVQIDRDGNLYDYRFINDDSVSAFIDYSVVTSEGEPIRMGNMILNHTGSDESAPVLTDNASIRRDLSLTDASDYDAIEVFGRVIFRFTVAGPVNAPYLQFQYKNLTDGVLNLRFKTSRPDAVYYASEEPAPPPPPENGYGIPSAQ